MGETITRLCRTCGLEGECRPGRWQCKSCDALARKEWVERTGRHVTGRRRNWRQHAEVQGVENGKTSWVTCSTCGQLKRYRPRPSGTGGVGWKALQCPDCTATKAREWRAAQKAEEPRSGPCSKCGQEGPYENGNQCRACFRAHAAEYVKERRAEGKGKPVTIPAHSKICGKCKQRCRVAGEWRGDVCPLCWKKAESIRAKRKRKELKQRMVNAGEWRCRQCGQVQPVDRTAKGWQGQKCPPCSRARARARYHEVDKTNPDYQRKKKARHRRDYQRRLARAAQDADSGPSAGVSGGRG